MFEKFEKRWILRKLQSGFVTREGVAYKSEKDRVCYSLECGEFWGIVYERQTGGFDLYLFWEMCDDFDFEEHKVDALKNLCDEDGEAFIAFMPGRYSERVAKEALKQWVHLQLGFPIT